MYSDTDVSMVLRDVLISNQGNVITEAMGLGIERAVLFYLNQLRKPEPDVNDVPEIE